jgi:hypothetical protein
MSQAAELTDWAFEQKSRKAVEALRKNGFTAELFPTRAEAAEYIVREAGSASSVGFGGSLSIAEMDLIERLRTAGKELLIHGVPGLSLEERVAIMRRQLTCDLFLAGTNALTLSGCLVNIDATGNRVGSMLFGPKKVIVVAGRNKLVDGDVAEAMRRVKRDSSPPNAKRLSFKTPCATTGFCSDCNSPDRICRVTTVIDRKPRLTDLHVLVVNEDLGL